MSMNIKLNVPAQGQNYVTLPLLYSNYFLNDLGYAHPHSQQYAFF